MKPDTNSEKWKKCVEIAKIIVANTSSDKKARRE